MIRSESLFFNLLYIFFKFLSKNQLSLKQFLKSKKTNKNFLLFVFHFNFRQLILSTFLICISAVEKPSFVNMKQNQSLLHFTDLIKYQKYVMTK